MSIIRDLFPINRVVALLSPVAITVAGAVSVWLAENLPFVSDYVDAGETEAIFLGAVAAGVAAVYKWLDGWSKYEERQDL